MLVFLIKSRKLLDMCNKFTEDIIPTWTCHFPDYHKRDNFGRKCHKLCLGEYLLRDRLYPGGRK